MKQITKEGIVSLGDFPQFTSDFFAGVSDGTGNFNGTATPSGSSKNPVTPTYTLLRSVIYDSITMSNNTTLLTNGFKIFCKGNVTINAGCFISNDGLPGGYGASMGSVGGTGAAAAPVADAPLGGTRGGAGGAGEN